MVIGYCCIHNIDGVINRFRQKLKYILLALFKSLALMQIWVSPHHLQIFYSEFIHPQYVQFVKVHVLAIQQSNKNDNTLHWLLTATHSLLKNINTFLSQKWKMPTLQMVIPAASWCTVHHPVLQPSRRSSLDSVPLLLTGERAIWFVQCLHENFPKRH